MIQKSEITARRKEIAEIRHADSVFRDIDARVKDREEYEQRWFWELLQNAKDSIEVGEKVKVKIAIDSNSISFSHSGNPFELDDILSLIVQGTSKAAKEGKTGRFGTGFMTTYLLSKEVEITGRLTNNQGCFKFLLNRNASSNDEFYKRQIESNEAFEESFEEESYLGDSVFQTRFVYQLDDLGKQTANTGLKSLDDLIPFTQLFNNQVESVIVVKDGKETTYHQRFITDVKVGDDIVREWSLETIVDNSIFKQVSAYTVTKDDFEIAILTEKDGSVEYLSRVNDEVPRLFLTFPLIGTEEIGIPFIINSNHFDLRVEREGVYLKDSKEDETENVNRRIIRDALFCASVAFGKLIQTKKIKAEYEIYNFGLSKDYKWMDHVWFKGIKKEIIEKLASLPIIPVAGRDDLVAFDNLQIPYSWKPEYSRQFWLLLSQNKEYNVPLWENTQKWVDIVNNLCAITDEKIDDHPSIRNVADLISGYMEKLESWSSFENNLLVDAIVWLNDFYAIVNSLYSSFPLDKAILLNQRKEFRKAEGMQWDDCQDKDLIKISNLLAINFDQRLILNSVHRFHISGVTNFDRQIGMTEIKNKVNEMKGIQLADTNNQEAIAHFLKWLIENQLSETIKDVKILYGRAKPEDEFIFEIFPKGKHLLLSPKPCFQQEYPLYASIIREKDCMHQIYSGHLTASDLHFLETNGFIHLSPLVVRTEKVDPKTLSLLIVDSEDLSLINDDDGNLKQTVELTFSDFAYLTSTDGHIYERSTTSTSSLERFKFLLLEAVEKDPYFDNDIQEFYIDGRKIQFRMCLWLYRAKSLQWVNVKNEGSEKDKKFSSELPSSKNLSELIKNEDAIIKKIKGDKQLQFLQKLGVGVSDLIRNTLPSDKLRQSWDKAITNMITSDADPELVGEIFNDPNIQKEYERRLKERGIIKRNQKIGQDVERLFKEIIVELQKDGFQLNIERKPFGSDYLLTDESSDLVNNNFIREGFKMNDWLIELKATGKEYAAMTPLQAQTSKDCKDNYALIIVPLDGTEPDFDYVKANAIVISNIGHRISRIISDYDDVEQKKNTLFTGMEGISVCIEDRSVRFNIGSEIWVGKEFDTIEKFIFRQFQKNADVASINTSISIN
jgi:hypothetical protein